MTDVEGAPSLKMECVGNKKRGRRSRRPGAPPRVPDGVAEQLEGLLPADRLAEAVRGLEPDEITGPDGLITRLAGRVIEAALGAEPSIWATSTARHRRVAPATSATARPRTR
jgi:hypothetical protein